MTAEGDLRELRVKIDVRYHLKLHALRLMHNKKMRDAVEEALEHYFDDVVEGDLSDDSIPAHLRIE